MKRYQASQERPAEAEIECARLSARFCSPALSVSCLMIVSGSQRWSGSTILLDYETRPHQGKLSANKSRTYVWKEGIRTLAGYDPCKGGTHIRFVSRARFFPSRLPRGTLVVVLQPQQLVVVLRAIACTVSQYQHFVF